jgi:hypothetical protein
MNANKKRRGRPPKGSADTKSESVLLRLDPSEKQGFTQAARIAGLPLSAWMRERLRQVAGGELKQASLAVPFMQEGKT